MFRQIVFYDNFTHTLTGTWWMFLLQGITLILLGVLVLLAPQVLVAMVAAAFMFVGAIFVILAWKTRRFRNMYRRWRDEFWEV